jgi:hypothetical protein
METGESKMKYRIEQCNSHGRTLWVIKNKRGKELSHHQELSEANITVQRYINEDRDFDIEGR